MRSLSVVYLDVAKVADFQWKNAYVSRTQGVCHVIRLFILFIYLFWSLGKV